MVLNGLHKTRGVVLALLLLGSGLGAQVGGAAATAARGEQALSEGRYAEAAKLFEEARKLSPSSRDIWRGLVLSHLRGNQLREAIAVGTRAVERWPEDASLHHWLGLAYFQAGQPVPALTELNIAAQLNQSSFDIRFDAALVLLSSKRFVEAAVVFEQAVGLNPQSAQAHVFLGRAYHNSNRTLKGIGHFQKALELDAAIAFGHYHMGFALESLGRFDEAIAEFENEIARQPGHAQMLFRLGHVLLKAGRHKEAVARLEESIAADPENARAHFDRGKGQLALGKFEQAEESLRRAIEIQPAYAAPHYQLSLALRRMGRMEEAISVMRAFSALKRNEATTGGMAYQPD